jgi:hypothetical protein
MKRASDNIKPDTLADDIIYGVREIAEFINLPPRQTYHWLETAALPARKIGSRWVASKSALRKRLGAA